MERREPPATAEGWYALHDLRRVDWDAWRAAPEDERERALAEAVEYLEAHEALEDADEGGSAVFSVVGHKADLLVFHLRPTTAHLDRAERAFEQTAFAGFTERASSYVSVTEVSGYVTEDLAEGIEHVESEGTRNYLRQRLHPAIPDAEHVCFYPMDKRRGPADNWYDLPFDERAELVAGHGDVGREYAGKVTQIITGSLGFDDYEWGVTLFADDPTEIKHLLYEMRFDPSSSRFAEFGPFYFGRRFPPADLPALLAGEAVPTGRGNDAERRDRRTAGGSSHQDEGASHQDDGAGRRVGGASRRSDGADRQRDGGGTATGPGDATSTAAGSRQSGRPPVAGGEAPHDDATTEELTRELRRLGFDPDEYEEAGFGLVVYTAEDAEVLVDDVDGLRGNFDHYDTHVTTTVRADAGRSAVVSLWDTERAANTAAGFLFDLPGVEEGHGGPLPGDENGEAGDDVEGTGGDRDDVEVSGDGVEGTGDHDDIRGELEDLGIYAGTPHGEDVYAMVLYSTAEVETLSDEVERLSAGFDRYDTHAGTSLYAGRETDRAAVVSLWETRDAARTAGDHLADLPGGVSRAGEESGFGTMGMFYTVKPAHREAFVERFETVTDLLADRDGHLETELLVDQDDENDMFIASQWASREDAMAFFRSDAFRETVRWGREVLAGRPRHVFLA